MCALLDLKALPGEERVTYEALGGLVMAELDRIPHVGDMVDWDGYRFEVMNMDGRRVDRLLVALVPGPEPEALVWNGSAPDP